jgi:hypothetical protein
MSSREILHGFINMLSNASLETVERVLRNYQTWPSQPPAGLEKFKQRITNALKSAKGKTLT